MITLLTALFLATFQTPPDEARMQRIGPHVPACIRGEAAPNELIETCAERLAVRAEAKAVQDRILEARRATERAEAVRLWGEPCDDMDEMTGNCPADRRMASHAKACIEARPEGQGLRDCVAHLEASGTRYDTWVQRAEEAKARAATPEPQAEPEPAPPPRPRCRRETTRSPDGASVSTTLICGDGGETERAAREALDRLMRPQR